MYATALSTALMTRNTMKYTWYSQATADADSCNWPLTVAH